MQNVDLVICAEKIFPIDPKDVLLEKHAIVVHRGLILDILPNEEARRCYNADEVVGKRLLANSQLTTIDEDKLRFKVRLWRDKIAGNFR